MEKHQVDNLVKAIKEYNSAKRKHDKTNDELNQALTKLKVQAGANENAHQVALAKLGQAKLEELKDEE